MPGALACRKRTMPPARNCLQAAASSAFAGPTISQVEMAARTKTRKRPRRLSFLHRKVSVANRRAECRPNIAVSSGCIENCPQRQWSTSRKIYLPRWQTRRNGDGQFNFTTVFYRMSLRFSTELDRFCTCSDCKGKTYRSCKSQRQILES